MQTPVLAVTVMLPEVGGLCKLSRLLSFCDPLPPYQACNDRCGGFRTMSALSEGCAVCDPFSDLQKGWAGDESGVILNNEMGLVGCDNNHTRVT